MERSDARQGAVIRFVVLRKSVARVIHEDLLATPGEYYIPYRSVKARIELFKAGRRNIEDDLHGSSTSSHQQQCLKKLWKKWVIW